MKQSLYTPKRSINKLGIGYCGACGKISKFKKVEDKWVCDKCGYGSLRIFDHHYKR